MKKPEFPPNENERLKELYRFEILDSASEQYFDDCAVLASEICETKISAISLVDFDRQWFKSKIGFETQETSREISFCGHTINQDEIFEIQNAEVDNRFHDNPLVTGEMSVKFYAGAPLVSKQGYKLGVLCVMHDKPKELTTLQKSALKHLSKQVMNFLEIRLKQREALKELKRVDFIVKSSDVLS